MGGREGMRRAGTEQSIPGERRTTDRINRGRLSIDKSLIFSSSFFAPRGHVVMAGTRAAPSLHVHFVGPLELLACLVKRV